MMTLRMMMTLIHTQCTDVFITYLILPMEMRKSNVFTIKGNYVCRFALIIGIHRKLFFTMINAPLLAPIHYNSSALKASMTSNKLG